MKAWRHVICSAGVLLACESRAPQRQSVNPGGAKPDAEVDASPRVGETSATSSLAPHASSTVIPTAAGESAPPVDGGPRVTDAGAPQIVYWGLQPGSHDPDAGVAEEVLARLEVMALGSRIMTHVSTGVHDDFAAILRAPDLDWVVTLPSDVFVAMDDVTVEAWTERVWQFGAAVRFLILGQHLETDLFGLPSAERGLLVQRLDFALRGAKAHAARPPESRVGVGVVTLADVPRVLLTASDVVALSYSAVEPNGDVTPPFNAYTQLRSRVEQVADLRLPVIIQDLAYPSATGDADQLAFFSEIDDWFSGAGAPNVRAVVVSSLNPPAASECELWASEWQVESGAKVRCSVGMRDVNGEPKPALNEVIALLAEFAQL